VSEPACLIRLESEVTVHFHLECCVPWLPARIGKASCVCRSSPVRSRSIRPPRNPKRFPSTSSTRAPVIASKYLKVDADTGEEVFNEDIVKGYKVDTDTFIEVTKEELENVALESTRTIDIDESVDKADIDPRYLILPYYLRPDGKVGHDAFAVIRETIREMDKVAIGRVVLTNREHIIALEPMDKGLVGTLLRYPQRGPRSKEYFDEIQDVKVTKDMLDLARHIVDQKSGEFEPEKFEDHHETALIDLINQKRNGKPITPKERPRAGNVALWRRCAEASAAPRPRRRLRRSRPRRRGRRLDESLGPPVRSAPLARVRVPNRRWLGLFHSSAGLCASRFLWRKPA